VERRWEWVCCWTHTLCIFTHDHAGQFRRRCGDWTRSIAWHNRHGTAHGTPSLLQCKVARREGSRSGPIWRQSEAACSVRLLCTAGSHNGTWPGRWLRCWGRHWDERQRKLIGIPADLGPYLLSVFVCPSPGEPVLLLLLVSGSEHGEDHANRHALGTVVLTINSQIDSIQQSSSHLMRLMCRQNASSQ
jgi:hypothetical protein